MESTGLKIAILNLTGELAPELLEYFTQRNLTIIDPLKSEEKQEWTHILTRDLSDFSIIRKTYNTIEKDIKLISLSPVNDPQNFMLANGKLVMDEVWMKGPLGNFILDKFFQEYAGLTLKDNYPKFEEKGAFNITNPFSTGDYLDRLVHHAFSENFAALSVRTYFDHLLMFLTGLKNKGKVGLPIEINYGSFDEVFAVQLHFFADGLMTEDITNCLSGSISRKAEEHLFSIAVQSSDFLDFTFLPEVKKVVITSLWSRGERLKVENRGLMFTTLTSAAGLQNFPYEGVTSQLLQNVPIQDNSDKVHLPEKSSSPEEENRVDGEQLSEALAERISTSMALEQVQQILKGDVSEEDPNKIVLGSTDDMDELVNLVKDSVEEEANAIKVSGGKLDVDKFAVKISAGIQEKAKGTMNVKSLGEILPQTIKTGLFDFAKGLNKQVEDLDEFDIHAFKSETVPELVKSHTVVGNDLSLQIRKELKLKLEEGLKSEFMEESAEAALSSIKGEEDEMRLKHLLKDSLKSSLDNNFQLAEKDIITDVEKDLLVKSLSVSLDVEENKIREIVASENKTKVQPLFNTPPSSMEVTLRKKLDASNRENELLKNKLKVTFIELKTLQDSRSQIASMKAQVKETAAAMAAASKVPDQDEQLRQHFQHRLNQDDSLNVQEQKNLSLLLERETKLIQTSRDKEMEARRIQIESAQREVVFTQQLQRANREIKAREIMLNKTRESLQKALEKKEAEKRSLQIRVDTLSQELAAGQGTKLVMIRDLEKQNQGLAKMVDMYKTKVADMMENMQATKSDDGVSKEELRKIHMLNIQFKNQAEAAKKELIKYRDKVAYDTAQMHALRQDKIKLEQQLKKLAQDTKKEQTSTKKNDIEPELRINQPQNPMLEGQVKELTTKLKDAETRLADALKSIPKQIVGTDDNKKVPLLEANVKKLTNDLLEARNISAEMKKETNKLRQEKTALQNQLDKLKKETEKAAVKAASHKKPDNNGKAA